jgi:hemoglobin
MQCKNPCGAGMSTLFDKIGADKLRAVVTDFYSRVFGDVMIGFLFEGKSRQHLIDREYEFTANFLGGDVKYTGRPMRTAHAQSPIFGGHFERRLQILRETLRDNAVDPEVQQSWIDHTLALRPQITRDKGSECKDTTVVGPKLAIAQPGPGAAAQVSGDPDKPVKLRRK